MPGREVVEIADGDPVFHTVFDLDRRGPIPGAWSLGSGRAYLSDGYEPHWRGVFDDRGRLLVAIWIGDLAMQLFTANLVMRAGGLPPAVASALHSLLEGNVKKVLISAALWLPYLLLSTRVNVTFRHRVPA